MKVHAHRFIFLLILLIFTLNIPAQIHYSAHSIFTTSLNVPCQIVFDTSGNLFIANHSFASYAGTFHNTIAKVDTAGNKTVFLSGYTWPSSLDIDQQQNIYFTQNNASSDITKVTPTGIPSTYATLPHSPGPISLYQSGASISVYTNSHWGGAGIYNTTALNTFSLFDGGYYLGNQVSVDGQFLYAWISDTLYRFNTSNSVRQVWVSKIKEYSPWAHKIGPDSNLYLIGKSLCDTSFQALFRVNGYEDVTEIITGFPKQSQYGGMAFRMTPGNQVDVYISEVVDGNRMDPLSNRIIRFDMTNSTQLFVHPDSILGLDTAICQPFTITMNQAQGIASVLWSTNDTTQSVTVSQPGVYSVLLTDSLGCHFSDTINILPCQTPFPPFFTDTIICAGDSLVIFAPSVTNPTNWLWSTNDTTPSITIAPVQSTVITVMVTNGNDTILDTCNVYVAYANAGPNLTICLGDSIQLQAGATTFPYHWTPAATLSDTTISNPIAFPQQTTVYYLTVEHCKDSLSITVVPYPVVSLGNDTTLCQGQPLALTPGVAFASYLWSTNATTPSITVTQTGQYWVIVKNIFNCESADTVEVTYISNPVITIQPKSDTICSGDQLVIKASSNLTPASYSWSTGPVIDSIVVNPTSINTYKVTVTYQGCSSSDSSVIFVKPIPHPTLYTNKTMICEGESTVIQAATIYPAVSYQWSSGQSTAMIIVSPLTTTTYTVTATVNGCSSDSSVVIQVNPLPVITLTVAPPIVCEGDTATFTAVSNIWGTQFQWSSGHTGPQAKITPLVPTVLTVTATVNGCTTIDSLPVGTKPVPDIIVQVSNDTICGGDTVIMSASSSMAGVVFLWSTGVFAPQLIVNPNITTSYTVIATANGCYSDTTYTIEVLPNPQLTVTPTPLEFCVGDQVTLNVSADLPGTTFLWSNNTPGSSVSFIATPTTTMSVSGFYMGCVRTEYLNLNLIAPPVISLDEDGFICEGETVILTPTGTYNDLVWWDGSTGLQNTIFEPGTFWITAFISNCARTDTVVYRECSKLIIPNVFTPNNDGYNNYFYPEAKSIEIRSMTIYNRSGSQVYHEDNPTKGWDGISFGMQCSEGIYYYVIKYYNPMVKTVQEKGGVVHLMR